MINGTHKNTGDQAFSKKQAAVYLGISVRSLENSMKALHVEYEKHGKKVVFRRYQLEDYRAKRLVGSKKDYSITAQKPTVLVPPSSILSNSGPKTILATDADELILELKAKALADRRLAPEGAKTFLVKLGGYDNFEADAMLADYENASFDAFQSIHDTSPKKSIEHMDWSFSISSQFIDFISHLEYWKFSGKHADEKIQIRRPIDPLIGCPERMLPCLKTISNEEFSESMRETHEFFSQRLITERKAFDSMLPKSGTPADRDNAWQNYCVEKDLHHGNITHYAGDLVPFKDALTRLPESANKKPFSFVGPITIDKLHALILDNFDICTAANMILGQALPLRCIVKLRWLSGTSRKASMLEGACVTVSTDQS